VCGVKKAVAVEPSPWHSYIAIFHHHRPDSQPPGPGSSLGNEKSAAKLEELEQNEEHVQD
jgi:hypothetical protein